MTADFSHKVPYVFGIMNMPSTCEGADALSYTASTCKYLLAICAFPILSAAVVAPLIAKNAPELESIYLSSILLFSALFAFYLWRVIHLTSAAGRIRWNIAMHGKRSPPQKIVGIAPLASKVIDGLKFAGLTLLTWIAIILVLAEIK